MSVGGDSLSVYHLDKKLKNRIGKYAYLISFLNNISILKKPLILMKRDEEEPLPCYGVIISTIRKYAGNFNVFPKRKSDQARLRVCFFKKGGFIKITVGFFNYFDGFRKILFLGYVPGSHKNKNIFKNIMFQFNVTVILLFLILRKFN